MSQDESPIKIFIDFSMVVGPVIGYVYQYWLIHKKQSIGTFSIDICGILLFANIMRMNFYIFKKYETALFLQSALMIAVQILLLQMCKSLSEDQIQENVQEKSFIGSIWRWKYFYQYFLFIIGFTLILTIISFGMLNIDSTGFYGELVGLLALTSESILILPQIIKNCKQGRVKGVSHLLLSFNLFGDIFKLAYFAIKAQPFQFILCGVTQVILDTFVISQIFYYKIKNKKKQQFTAEQVEQKPPSIQPDIIQQNNQNIDQLGNIGSNSQFSEKIQQRKTVDTNKSP